ncbi:hypothetical protein BD410DRAFT_258162 [Rickenella mellea]|uniref:F-box domain-containing protein n=1 Tax=Rickenella mellea TaxID=50990 RepID=A0A4Y7Q6A2_9AGAM|nr:hypothetical protein BD410DRAFT_258162 [Rickenella mellea]
MPSSPNTPMSPSARNIPDHRVDRQRNPHLPTELWTIIIRMAAHLPLDFDFTSGDTWEVPTVIKFKQIMETKFSLMIVSRQFNAIVSEFLFEFVYISTMRLSLSIASQKEWDRKRTWRHSGLKKAMAKPNMPVSRPTNVTDLSSHANVNIRYLFVEENGGSHRSDYDVSLANFLKSKCCSNLVGLFIASDWQNWMSTPTTIAAIPSGLKFLSWNAPANGHEFSALLARLSSSLERLRIRRVRGASRITFPKVTHYAQVRGRGFGDLPDEWEMPSLTHLTLGFGRSDGMIAVYPTSLLDDFEYLQLHLRPRSCARVTVEQTTIATPHPTMHPIIIICHEIHDLGLSFASVPELVQAVLQICHRDRFPKMKAVDIFGVHLHTTSPWRLRIVGEAETLLQGLTQCLSIPGVEVRVMS